MRVIGFVGSPRKEGNTTILVEKILSGAAAAGAETKVYNLNELNIRGCQACNYCKTHNRCQQEDDMTPLYDELIAADAIVIGSPIYMGYLSAQTKLFLDRLYAFFNPGGTSALPRGKKAALVYSQGGGDNAELIESLAKSINDLFGMEVKGIVGGNGLNEPGAVKKNDTLIDKAFKLGGELVK